MSSHSLPSARRTAVRTLSAALPILGLLLAAPALHADSITYDVTLSPTQGVYGGTGTITVGTPPSSSGDTTYSQKDGTLQGLSFVIDGQTFSLSPDSGASVQFINGTLHKITFAQTIGNYPNRFQLDTGNGYSFFYNLNDEGYSESAGKMTASLVETAETAETTGNPTAAAPATTPGTSAPAATPEPGSLVLLATALLAGGFFLFRRKRTAES